MRAGVYMRDSEQHSVVGLEARWAGSLRGGVSMNRKSPATSCAGGHRAEAPLAGDPLSDPDPTAALSGLAVEADREVRACPWSDIPVTQASVSWDRRAWGQEGGSAGELPDQASGNHLESVWNQSRELPGGQQDHSSEGQVKRTPKRGRDFKPGVTTTLLTGGLSHRAVFCLFLFGDLSYYSIKWNLCPRKGQLYF